MRPLFEAAALAVAGAALSFLSTAVGGRVGPGDLPQMVLALEAQAPVLLWRAADAAPRDGLLVLDGRAADAHRRQRPAGAVHVPFAARDRQAYALPEGRQVDAVVVVADDPAEARALAQWVVREWGVTEVATRRGGFEAWRAAGLPTEEGEPR